MATINPKDLKIKHSDIFFFDTNVWILIFAPIANYQKSDQRLYTELLDQLMSRDGLICINSMVISEFANVLLRIDYKQWISDNELINPDYKRDFVGSNAYKSSVDNVKILIDKILKIPIIQRVSDGFNHVNIDGIYNNFGIADFNDAYIIEIAKTNGYIVVTNDVDFKEIKTDIDIITTKC